MSQNGEQAATPAEEQNRPSRKTRVRGGHRSHLTTLLKDVATQLTGYTSEREAKMLTNKGCLERKAIILTKLDEEILEEIEDDTAIAAEIEIAEAIQNQIQESIIKIEKALKDVKK